MTKARNVGPERLGNLQVSVPCVSMRVFFFLLKFICDYLFTLYIGINGAESNCRVARVLGFLLS